MDKTAKNRHDALYQGHDAPRKLVPADSKRGRLPFYLRRPLGTPSKLHEMKRILRQRGLHTVCESARCPNIGECFSKPTATFMILGNVCTRSCSFCGVDKGVLPAQPQADEPHNIALTVKELGLRHAVITSVTRDDLPLGGATQFALTIKALKDTIPRIFVEVLTPDFNGDEEALLTVFAAKPDIFNHNLETVPRLYPLVRPQADYRRSLKVLESAKKTGLLIKSGIMAGLGEREEEVKKTLEDLRLAGCDAVTIGQYLRPSSVNLEVKEYIAQEVFDVYAEYGKSIGIRAVSSGPFVRSSYNAEEIFEETAGGKSG